MWQKMAFAVKELIWVRLALSHGVCAPAHVQTQHRHSACSSLYIAEEEAHDKLFKTEANTLHLQYVWTHFVLKDGDDFCSAHLNIIFSWACFSFCFSYSALDEPQTVPAVCGHHHHSNTTLYFFTHTLYSSSLKVRSSSGSASSFFFFLLFVSYMNPIL